MACARLSVPGLLLLASAIGCGPGEVGGGSDSSAPSTGESSESGTVETGATDELGPETETDTRSEMETGSETETETETGDELAELLDGELPEGPCTITPGPSDDAACEGGPCPLTTDVLVSCDGFGFPISPTTVAPGNEGPRLLIGDTHYLELSGGSGELVPFPPDMPAGFPRFAQDAAGELVVVAIIGDNWASESWPAGVHRLAPLDTPQWAREFGVAGDYSNDMDGLEIDLEDRLHVWSGPQPEAWISRDEAGVWAEQEDLASNVGGPRTLTVDGTTAVNFRYVATQLNAEINGEKFPLGTPQGSQSNMIRVARRPKPGVAGIGPEYAVTTTHDTGTQIHWLGGERLVPEAAYMPPLPCPPDHDPELECEPSCSFDLTGVVEETEDNRERVAVARTGDGTLWLAWIETHYVLEYNYTQVCPGDPDPCECEPEVITDERTTRLRLLRYDFVGEPVEVLSMPFEGVYGSPRPKVVADAFADRLVLSLVVDGLGPARDDRGFRVLELDTDAL